MARALIAALSLLGAAAYAEGVLVCAASSTADALEEVSKAFEPGGGARVHLAYGASSDLARQILAGSPCDVFLSADIAQMRRLEQSGAVLGSEVKALLSNRLVVIVPHRSKASVSGADDLALLRRVALADPEAVPVGVYARVWLERAGVWAQVARRLVPTMDARSALAAVESANADAGVVYATDAMASKKVRIAYRVPPAESPEIIYPVAPLARSGPAARRFVEFLESGEASRIFLRHGFEPAG
ncbi:MAG: molybdate ABC transporter substrate-binding protein [Myxococcales bacterium]|nr:molybdate ABC transporter substrate-binding protein [Myxococcales bacterium]